MPKNKLPIETLVDRVVNLLKILQYPQMAHRTQLMKGYWRLKAES